MKQYKISKGLFMLLLLVFITGTFTSDTPTKNVIPAYLDDLLSELERYIQMDVQRGTTQDTPKLHYNLTRRLQITNPSMLSGASTTMNFVGPNHLYSIQSIHLWHEAHQLTIESASDWLSPYQVKAQANASLSAPPRFTGGWHGQKGNHKGSPTATMKSVLYYSDGKQLTPNSVGHGRVIHILTNQCIQGYNTKRDLIDEYTLYTFVGNTVKVRVIAFALETLTIEKLYGIETQNTQFDGLIHYHFQNGTTLSQSTGISSNSGKRTSAQTLSYISLTGINHPFVLQAKMNYDAGFKRFPYLGADVPEAFTASYGKSYFNLINGIPLVLTAGERFQWSGQLTFSSNASESQ